MLHYLLLSLEEKEKVSARLQGLECEGVHAHSSEQPELVVVVGGSCSAGGLCIYTCPR